jgi:hypothetical protein
LDEFAAFCSVTPEKGLSVLPGNTIAPGNIILPMLDVKSDSRMADSCSENPMRELEYMLIPGCRIRKTINSSTF